MEWVKVVKGLQLHSIGQLGQFDEKKVLAKEPGFTRKV
jgi:hypothetical protein